MPWVDDPETGTSHYERPKKKRLRAKTMADLFNESQAARDQVKLSVEAHTHLPETLPPDAPKFHLWYDDPNEAQLEDTTFDGTPLNAEELARAARELGDSEGPLAPRVRRAGDGLGKLRKGERYTKDPVLDSLEVQGS